VPTTSATPSSTTSSLWHQSQLSHCKQYGNRIPDIRKNIPKSYDKTAVDILAWSTPIKTKQLKVCLATLVVIDIAYVAASLTGIPVFYSHLLWRNIPFSGLLNQPQRRKLFEANVKASKV